MDHGKLRLLRLREITEAVEEEMVDERARFSKLANADAPRAISSFNLFQTPTHIANQMATLLGAGRTLEPSAGLGRLAIAARDKVTELVAVENNPDCCSELFRMDWIRLVQADFLSCDSERLGGLFDQVIMNPPFKQGTDIKHIRHAIELLKPDGLLVALCYNGVKQNRDLKPIATTWEVLPENSFKETGTRASVVMMTYRKG